VAQPNVKDVVFKDTGLSFVAEVEIKPDVEIDPKLYEKIKFKLEPLDVADSEISKYLESIKANLAMATGKKVEEIDTLFVSRWAGYSSEDEFRASVRSEVHLNKVMARRRSIEKQFTDTLLSKVSFDVPESVVADQKQRIIQQKASELARRGIPREEIEKHFEEITKGASSVADDQVKMYYILEAIARKEGLRVDQNNLIEIVLGHILSKAMAQ
jgi:trigger factor